MKTSDITELSTELSFMGQSEMIQLVELMRLELVLNEHPLGQKISERIATGIPSKTGYSHKSYSKIILRHVLGMTLKDYRELHGLKDNIQARANLTIEQLLQVHSLELQVAKIVEEVGSSVSAGELKIMVRKVLHDNRS